MTSTKIRKIFTRFRAANPHPTTELIYHNPYQLLVAVILSAQATDVSVNKATASLFAKVSTPEEMLKLGLTHLKKYIRTIGLYNNKAQNIIKTSEILVAQFNGQVPAERTALESLPGVGRKTANVILNTFFKEHVIAVDTHIFRVAQRIGLVHGKTPLAIEQQLMRVIPKEFLADAHHWLILHGRYVCTARQPHCATCLIKDLCEYPDKNL